ncbi:hypothetical protein B566_EDAN010368, partial [Ephemera danica]
MANYWQYVLQLGTKARFKRSVVPHKFECQEEYLRRNPKSSSPTPVKSRRKELVTNTNLEVPAECETEASTSYDDSDAHFVLLEANPEHSCVTSEDNQ